MTAPSPAQAERFYRAGVLGLRALEAREGRGRRLGPAADATWRAFRGDPGELDDRDRLDLLLRDAAATSPLAFAPRRIFALAGLSDDEPFGHEWPGLPVSLARLLLREAAGGLAARPAHVTLPDPQVLSDADRAGPSGPDWPNLRDLMRESAERVVRDLVAKNESVLLTHPGLLARYRLDGVLATLVEATQRDDGPAVFLLVPAYLDPGPAPIDAVPQPMPIPQISPAQRLRVPESWIENRHRAGE
jgi:hypothetical protein